MAKQARNGKAFEWAVATAISEITGYEIIENDAARVAANCYEAVPERQRNNYVGTALAGVRHILEKEQARLANKTCLISLASDAEGQIGDVRDVIIKGDD
jgi:HaeIII restriction endonuclease